MEMSSSGGFAQWAYGIGRLHHARHGRTDIRRGSSVRSDGIVLTMSLCSANDISPICSIPTKKYYNEAPTHQSLHKDEPNPRTLQNIGRTLAVPLPCDQAYRELTPEISHRD